MPIDANGLRFKCAVAGEGPVVVLLHGFPDTLRVWQRQIGALAAAGYRVIAPDQRGCGDSDVPDGVGAYRLETLADDIIALLDRSEEHTSELQSLMRISYAVFCLKKKKINNIKPKTQR